MKGPRDPGERRLVMLTGERGAGKSTACLRLAEVARAQGLAVAGIVSRGVYDGERRVGLAAVDLASLETWPLASTLEPLGGPTIGPFSFDPTGLARSLAVLEAAAGSPAALLAIDEIGPLELSRREGFYPILPRLASAVSPDLLLVVRPSLLERLSAVFPHDTPTVLAATAESRDGLPRALLQALQA